MAKQTKNDVDMLAVHYAEYVRQNRIEPDVKTFNRYLADKDVEGKMTKKNWSTIREIAFSENEDLSDLALNESYFTEEYFQKLEEMFKNCKTYVIATAVTGKAAKAPFYETLKSWAKQNRGQVLLLPSADIQNSKTIFKMNFDPMFKDENTWIVLNRPNATADSISADETPDGYYLNKHLWLSCVKTGAKTVDPIGGWKDVVTSKDASIIVSSPRQQLSYAAALKHKTPRATMSTGACTVNNYYTDLCNSQKTRTKAREAHQFGAIIVEVADDNIFHFRQIQSKDGESFTDLYAKYTSDGEVTRAQHTTLVMGDSHAGATDYNLLRTILADLVAYSSIDEIILHDLCDSAPVNPHNQGKLMSKVERYKAEKYELTQLFNEIAAYLNTVSEVVPRVVVVPSNHDDMLLRAIDNLKWWLDDVYNTEALLKMAVHRGECQEDNLLQFCVENLATVRLNHPERIKWLKEDESYVRHGCELGQHGHLGANGSRGSIKQYEQYVGNAVIGHSHSAGIKGDTFQVGTTAELDQKYNKGLSSWTRTCCLVHEDGTKQLINFIPDGKGGYSFRVKG